MLVPPSFKVCLRAGRRGRKIKFSSLQNKQQSCKSNLCLLIYNQEFVKYWPAFLCKTSCLHFIIFSKLIQVLFCWCISEELQKGFFKLHCNEMFLFSSCKESVFLITEGETKDLIFSSITWDTPDKLQPFVTHMYFSFGWCNFVFSVNINWALWDFSQIETYCWFNTDSCHKGAASVHTVTSEKSALSILISNIL